MNNNTYTVICGHYGCGKTNLSLNLAIEKKLSNPERRVILVDIDIVNPYFRSSEYGKLLTKHGIELIIPSFANTTLDTPTLSPKIFSIFTAENADIFIDAAVRIRLGVLLKLQWKLYFTIAYDKINRI